MGHLAAGMIDVIGVESWKDVDFNWLWLDSSVGRRPHTWRSFLHWSKRIHL